MFQFVDPLNLRWREELAVNAVILLSQVKDFLAAFHALLDGLLGFGFGLLRVMVTMVPGPQRP